jgi:predicted RNA-binding Zn ribbon-like protein
MLDPGSYPGSYEASAENLALDFINTVSWRVSDHPHEWLNSFDNLLAWGEVTGVLTPAERESLHTAASQRPDLAEQVRLRAVHLREAVYRTIIASISLSQADAADLETLNGELYQAFPFLQFAQQDGKFSWRWGRPADRLDWMLWPVVRAATELLLSDHLERVGQCMGVDCGWMFLDMSKNRSRRWCDMNDCGNRAKARKHYHKVRNIK